MPEPQSTTETFEDIVGSRAATPQTQQAVASGAGEPIYLSKFVGWTRAEVEEELQQPEVRRLLQAHDVRVTFEPVQGSVGQDTPDRVVDQVPPPDDASEFNEVYPGTTLRLSYIEGEPEEELTQQILKKLDEFDAAMHQRFEQLMQAVEAIKAPSQATSTDKQTTSQNKNQ